MPDLNELHSKYLKNELSAKEVETFFDQVNDPAQEAEFHKLMDSKWDHLLDDSRKNQAVVVVHSGHFLKTSWFRYAAALLLIAGTAVFLYKTIQESPKEIFSASREAQPVILPGGNRATLTLSDGSTIVLDSAANGSLARQGGANIVKLGEGVLAYQGNNVKDKIGVNTISTPRGGKYQIELPDGSKVWLNAASSITFPTFFAKDRKVIITGEVYMEIAKDKTRPFLVSANEMQIQVLGTSFNVNVYNDEPSSKVTLVEGSIHVGSTRLQPGEAFVNGKIETTDVQQDLAWKNGAFNLNNKTLPELMRQIARWYDLEIVYEKPVRTRKFEGEMGMNLTLPQCLRALETMQVKCRLEGRKLTVMP